MADDVAESRAIKVSTGNVGRDEVPSAPVAPSIETPTTPLEQDSKETIGSREPASRLWIKLLLALVGLTVLLMVTALVRQEVVHWPPSPRLVVVLKYNLPAYHQIKEADLTSQIRFAGRTEAETLKRTGDIVGRYTLEALHKDNPIAEMQLGPAVNDAQFSGKLAIEVSVPDVSIANEQLKAGDVIDINVESSGQGQQSKESTSPSFQNIFVLNVKSSENSAPAAKDHPAKNYLLILALPMERHAELEAEIVKKTRLTFRKKQLTR